MIESEAQSYIAVTIIECVVLASIDLPTAKTSPFDYLQVRPVNKMRRSAGVLFAVVRIKSKMSLTDCRWNATMAYHFFEGYMSTCLACGRMGAFPTLALREMFFGTREEFAYDTCTHCESIQIVAPLSSAQLKEHYPSNYYAFDAATPLQSSARKFRTRHRAAYEFGETRDWIGRFLSRRKADYFLRSWLEYGLKREMRVLDVGCGSGKLLHELSDRGMTHLVGIDPYINQESHCGVIRLRKGTIEVIDEEFDFIMFNHSLEHVQHPLSTLIKAQRLLSTEGIVVIRLPTCSSEAYEIYGKDWFQLDPPRHTFIPSRAGMAELGRRAGLALISIRDDSVGYQFWGSEQYQRDIATTDSRSYFSTKSESMFTHEEIEQYEQRACKLNAIGRGDQAAFLFRRDCNHHT